MALFSEGVCSDAKGSARVQVPMAAAAQFGGPGEQRSAPIESKFRQWCQKYWRGEGRRNAECGHD